MSSPDAPSDDGAAPAADGAEVTSDASNESTPETQPDDQPDPEPEAGTDADAPAAEAEPETEPEPEPEADAEPPADADSASELSPEPEPESEPAPEPVPGPELATVAAAVSSPDEMVPVRAGRKWTPTKRHRTWSQRLLLGLNCFVILACFAGAAGLLIGRHYGNRVARVDLAAPPGATDASGLPVEDNPTDDPVDQPVGSAPSVSGPDNTFPAIDPEAKNFLITGADNNACIDPGSPYAAAFGDRETMGERSDTIMLMRVDPSTRRAAVLSFPRDLWVKIDGRSGKNRINSAYVRDDPQRLINTLYGEFGLPVDHFIQVDFCAFKVMVEAVGGVTVPFEFPARDTHTGLFVEQPGCYTFNGDHALAYVRSRYYQYFEDGKWKSDPQSDLGRISRQQDFLRRVLSSALAKGFDPGVARDIIKAAEDYVVLDRQLTITRMLEFAGILSDFEPGSLATYQIEAHSEKISGNSVLVPDIDGENMQAILLMFRGGSELAAAPEQVFDPTTTTTDPDAPPPDDSTVDTVGEGPQEIVKGVVPPDDMAC